MRPRFWQAWLLAFSLGLNAVLIGMALRPAPVEATAQPRHEGGPRGGDFNWLDPEDPELALNADQKQRLEEIRRRMEGEDLLLRKQTVERMESLGRVLVSDQLDSREIEPLLLEMSSGSENFMLRVVRSLREQRAVLDAEQNRLMTKRLAERFEQMVHSSQRRLERSSNRLAERYGQEYVDQLLESDAAPR